MRSTRVGLEVSKELLQINKELGNRNSAQPPVPEDRLLPTPPPSNSKKGSTPHATNENVAGEVFVNDLVSDEEEQQPKKRKRKVKSEGMSGEGPGSLGVRRLDPAFQVRGEDRKEFGRFDEVVGRFVLREASQITPLDIEFLVALAAEHGQWSQRQFLEGLMSDWPVSESPSNQSVRGPRANGESYVPCVIMIQDSHNKKEGLEMVKTGKKAGELGLFCPPHRKDGQTVFVKVYPAPFTTRFELVGTRQL
jgi:hypothetical protein